MTDKNRFTSVWDAIEDTPQEAASMKARSALMMELSAAIQERGIETPKEDMDIIRARLKIAEALAKELQK